MSVSELNASRVQNKTEERHPMARAEILQRLNALNNLNRAGHEIIWRDHMTDEELLVIYKTIVQRIRNDDEEKAKIAQLCAAMLTLEMQQILPPGMAGNLLERFATSAEILAELAKHIQNN